MRNEFTMKLQRQQSAMKKTDKQYDGVQSLQRQAWLDQEFERSLKQQENQGQGLQKRVQTTL